MFNVDSELATAEKADLRLDVCDTSFAFSASSDLAGGTGRSNAWTGSVLDWSLLTPVGIYLSLTPALPSAPQGLTATAGDTQVALAWTAPSNNAAGITDYELRYAAGDDVPDTEPWKSAGSNLAETVTGLANGTKYAFEVRAVNGDGAAASVTTTPVFKATKTETTDCEPGLDVAPCAFGVDDVVAGTFGGATDTADA